VAEAFAAQGWAVVGIDINYHGARTACVQDTDCAAGGKCTAGACSTSLAVKCSADSQCTAGGTCKSGACSTALADDSSLCMHHVESGNKVVECNPAASGSAFLNLSSPFVIRDNLRQHVVDLTQLERVITSADFATALAGLAQPVAINTSAGHTAFIGMSLGAITGSLFMSVAPQPVVGVLNVPGGRLVDVFLKSSLFSTQVPALLAANHVVADTAGYYQLINIFRWIVDPGDPINFGRYTINNTLGSNPSKKVIVQEAGMDTVIPNAETDALCTEIGLPFLDNHPAVRAVAASMPASPPDVYTTFFPMAAHGFLTSGEASTAAGQAQAVTWIASGGTLIAPVQ
jgi:hypothetical protein